MSYFQQNRPGLVARRRKRTALGTSDVRVTKPVDRPSPMIGWRRPPPLWDGSGRRAALGNFVDLRTELGLGDVADGSLPCPSGNGVCPPFIPSVEAWRSDVAAQAGGKPVDFLLAWIQKESAGNPCSWTYLKEAGIFQLMAGDNMVQGGTSIEQQHPVPPCAAGTQTTAFRSSLTDDQAHEQVRGGMQYVDYCRSRAEAFMGQYGYLNAPGWSDSDWSYWAMVKMYHALPGAIPGLLSKGLQSGGIPSDWDQMMQYSSSNSATANARAVGLFGEGGGSLLSSLTSIAGGDKDTLFIVALGGLALAAWLLT